MASPVLVSFDSTPVPISDIPFPAFTICNMNKVSICTVVQDKFLLKFCSLTKVMKRKVDEIDLELAEDSTNAHFQIEKEFVEEICLKHVHGGSDEEASVILLVSFFTMINNSSGLLIRG